MIINHLSDLHICDTEKFNETALLKCIDEINNNGSDITIITGDITNEGLLKEYKRAKEYIKTIDTKVITLPGNHCVRNNGKRIWDDVFGKRKENIIIDGINIITIDSSQEDTSEGHIGEMQREWLKNEIYRDLFTIISLHHHVLPIPNSGRERNILLDSGDFMKICLDNKVNLVLNGHKHVANNIKIEDTIFSTVGSVSNSKLRGYEKNNYNLIHIKDGIIDIENKNIL